MPATFHEDQLKLTISFREKLDALIQAVHKDLYPNREVALIITKLQEARMWAGQNCANHGSDYGTSQYAHKATEPESL